MIPFEVTMTVPSKGPIFGFVVLLRSLMTVTIVKSRIGGMATKYKETGIGSLSPAGKSEYLTAQSECCLSVWYSIQ